jgi:hypothetical protein
MGGQSVLNPGVVVTGAGRAPMPRLLGEGRLEPPSLLDVIWNSSMESSIMTHRGDGDPLRVKPMKAATELLLLGERLKPPKSSAMNSKLPRRTVSPREKPPHVKRSPSAATASADKRTIKTSREKAQCKSPYQTRQLSVFSTPANYGVVKITRSSSEMVLLTIEHIMINPGSGPFLEVIVIRPVV